MKKTCFTEKSGKAAVRDIKNAQKAQNVRKNGTRAGKMPELPENGSRSWIKELILFIKNHCKLSLNNTVIALSENNCCKI
jgi:hypothetical protein